MLTLLKGVNRVNCWLHSTHKMKVFKWTKNSMHRMRIKPSRDSSFMKYEEPVHGENVFVSNMLNQVTVVSFHHNKAKLTLMKNRIEFSPSPFPFNLTKKLWRPWMVYFYWLWYNMASAAVSSSCHEEPRRYKRKANIVFFYWLWN